MSQPQQPNQTIQRPVRKRTTVQLGYGLVLLMMFLASTVLLGASLQTMAGPSTASYLGTTSQDLLAAKGVAESGMETVLVDIQTQLNNSTLVTTSYTYPSTPVTMPSDPAALGGATTTIGSYSATMTAARGNAYLVKVTALVGTATAMVSRLVTMNRANPATLDSMTTPPNMAYGMRKLLTTYAGSAIRVRRSSDDTEQDIGFDGAGNLDMDSLNTFLSTSTLPINQVNNAGGGLPVVAFGLRRLRQNTNFGAALIKVRRSSDNAEQDIGFTPAGDLDINALLDFVGNGTGYVKTWYDQSGNGTNATQATTTMQPTIVVSGAVNLINNRPSIKYDGVDDFLGFSRTISDDFTIVTCYDTIAGTNAADSTWTSHAGIVDMEVATTTNDFGVSADTGGSIYGGVGNPDTSIVQQTYHYNDGRMHWLAFSRTKSTGIINLYVDTGSFSSAHANIGSLTAGATITIGQTQTAAQASLNGYIDEVLVYSTVLSTANRQLLERNEAWYFNMMTAYLGVTRPLDQVGSATAAYGIRQLRNAYAGKLIKVRRSSDNTTQDIGYDGLGYLDVKSLMTFVGAGSGYIDTWYDQSGNANDATQVTAASQPRIVNAGVLEMLYGKPTIRLTGSTYLARTDITAIGDYTALGVAQKTSSGNEMVLLAGNTANRQLLRIDNANRFHNYDGSSDAYIVNGFSYTSLNTLAISRSGTTSTGYYNGVATGTLSPTGTSGAMYFGNIGALANSPTGDSRVSELILYSSAVSAANIQTLQRYELFYFAAPVPTAYVSKWYDQSGNGNDAVQNQPTYQPILVLPRYGAFLNRPTVMFNGSQFLESATGMPTSADYSKTAVFSYYTTAATNNIMSSVNGVNGHAFYMNSSNYLTLFHTGVFVTSNLLLAINTNYAACATFVQSSKTGTVYRSNISGGSATTGSSNTNAGLQLGAHQTGNWFKGSISEAMVFARVLSTTDRTAIYNDERAYYAAE